MEVLSSVKGMEVCRYTMSVAEKMRHDYRIVIILFGELRTAMTLAYHVVS